MVAILAQREAAPLDFFFFKYYIRIVGMPLSHVDVQHVAISEAEYIASRLDASPKPLVTAGAAAAWQELLKLAPARVGLLSPGHAAAQYALD